MPIPQLDPPARLADERPRYYSLTTPGGTAVVVRMAGVDEPTQIQIVRPVAGSIGVEATKLDLEAETTLALWACLGDGVAAGGQPPAWLPDTITPTDGTGVALGPVGADRPF